MARYKVDFNRKDPCGHYAIYVKRWGFWRLIWGSQTKEFHSAVTKARELKVNEVPRYV